MANTDELWKQAKQKCRLNNEDIARAKRLGLNPQSLMKNVPNKSEPWKAPVKDWLIEIEEKRNKKVAQKQRRREAAGADKSKEKADVNNEKV